MDKETDFFDGWLKSQKDFLENWVKNQREFMENWTESTKKMQEAFSSQIGSHKGRPGEEMFELYNSLVTAMVDSSKVFTEEAIKTQETWKHTVEKQMELSKEIVKNFSELVKQTAEGKK
ncbi:MAG: hypothetical protein ABSA46_21425 [Thermodesulfovibrionales bacterium]|jgi:hypothetical protein